MLERLLILLGIGGCMVLVKGSKIVVFKYADIKSYDCIYEHNQLLRDNGYVWFGKLGQRPTDNRLSELLHKYEEGILILKNRDKLFLCTFTDFRSDRPLSNEYPPYYDIEILNNQAFSVWLKLTSIKRIKDKAILDNVVVKSSRQPILDSMSRSMCSYFFSEVKEDIKI